MAVNCVLEINSTWTYHARSLSGGAPAYIAEREKKVVAGAGSIEPFQVSGWRGAQKATSYGFSMVLFGQELVETLVVNGKFQRCQREAGEIRRVEVRESLCKGGARGVWVGHGHTSAKQVGPHAECGRAKWN